MQQLEVQDGFKVKENKFHLLTGTVDEHARKDENLLLDKKKYLA